MIVRMIVAGSREYNNYEELSEILKYNIDRWTAQGFNIEIVSGCARGADSLGAKYGEEHNIKVKYMPADWDTYGKSAGYRRNADMLNYAKEEYAVVFAFWNGTSKGTKNMIDIACKSNVAVLVTYFN